MIVVFLLYKDTPMQAMIYPWTKETFLHGLSRRCLQTQLFWKLYTCIIIVWK